MKFNVMNISDEKNFSVQNDVAWEMKMYVRKGRCRCWCACRDCEERRRADHAWETCAAQPVDVVEQGPPMDSKRAWCRRKNCHLGMALLRCPRWCGPLTDSRIMDSRLFFFVAENNYNLFDHGTILRN